MLQFERVFILLVIFQYTHQAPKVTFYKEKEKVPINCDPPIKGSVITWFRVREDKIDFLGTFTRTGEEKKNAYPTLFSTERIRQNTLTLIEFQKARDSGTYYCSSFNNNILNFGKATHIDGVPEAKPTTMTAPPPALPRPRPSNSTCFSVPCTCKRPMDIKVLDSKIKCELMIFAPLAGGCALLILILIITICYCNRIRTKRCPHHYKRRPKNSATVRQAMPDRYV
ncbi:T-cell surface glycoprotein CD8 alpha chain-like [Conger conger]|uniref:T-cell surface glycoprotein CD8 alpha chain-like n=1 Tax=Conger conger TaxID=82655 RepID=UPI002A59F38F|nr:T-cell surface glycoprotein CD8 alpha chain-like [Conger conger]